MKRFFMVAISVFVLIGLLVVPACGNGTDPDPTEFDLTMVVSPTGGGLTTPAVGTIKVEAGATVIINAEALGDYEFVNWSAVPARTFSKLPNDPEDNSFVMPSSNVVVTATFLLPVVYTFTGDQVKIGIAGEVDHATGDMAWLGASLATAPGGPAQTITIGDKTLTVVLSKIDTKEAEDESGTEGVAAMTAAIPGVHFVMGGFRTEAVEVYRDVVMDAKKLFFNCGAATESLQRGAATNYDRYQYWFKTTPPNEYFLAESVLRIVDSVAKGIRSELGLAEDAILDAVIISENLKWAKDEQVPLYQAGLPDLNINVQETYLVSALDPAGTSGVLASIATTPGIDPHIIIPVYSGMMGAVYAMTLDAYLGGGAIGAMSAGINVFAQLNQPWAAKLTKEYGDGHAECAHHVILDTWATGVAQTDLSLDFLAAFQTFAGGEYPLYTAATYDALIGLKAALQAVGYVDGGVAKAKARDIIAWLEDPANAQKTTIGPGNTVYPQPGSEHDGKPALSQAQVASIYPIATYGYTYAVADWVMPPHTTHDLAYGPGRATGIGAQWQWNETVTPNRWLKVGVWPAETGTPQVDQYGDWDFEYTGTVPLVIPDYISLYWLGA